LADIYYYGHGVVANKDLAVEYYAVSALSGITGSQERLTNIAESENNSRAQYFVGFIFERGLYSGVLGQVCDYKNAARWYSRAAKNGSSDARNALGRIGACK
jgi:TPR repeat protein